LHVARSFSLDQVLPQPPSADEPTKLQSLSKALRQDSMSTVADSSREAMEELIQSGTRGAAYGAIAGFAAALFVFGYRIVTTAQHFAQPLLTFGGVSLLTGFLGSAFMVTQTLRSQLRELKDTLDTQA
jgi:hypothetical protein